MFFLLYAVSGSPSAEWPVEYGLLLRSFVSAPVLSPSGSQTAPSQIDLQLFVLIASVCSC